MPRLDRHLSAALGLKRRDVRLLLAQRRIQVDGRTATDINHVIGRFNEVRFDGRTTQARTARYLMLNKPRGSVSATSDDRHPTVIDLLEQPWKNELHIAGRLDFNSTGLLLLTNDGLWSRRLSLPESKLLKRYRVRVGKALTENQAEGFRRGLYFRYEGITTRPAQLTILDDFHAEVGMTEGRYHQIRRMFSQLGNRVLNIHRFAVGPLTLDSGLAPGQSRALTSAELESLASGD